MISIVPYSSEFESLHEDFAKKYWTKKRRFHAKYIYWKFRKKNFTEFKSFILAIDNGKVIGQLGLIPTKINIRGKIFETQWACDLMVDKEYRGKDVAKQLYEFAHDNKEITLGSDPSFSASKSMKKNGYKSLNAAWKYVFALNLNELTKFKGLNFKFFNFIINPFTYLFIIFNKLFLNKFSKIEIEDYLNFINENIDLKLLTNIVHDKSFLEWRLNKFEDFYIEKEIYRKQNAVFSGYFLNDTYYITTLYYTNIFSVFSIIGYILNNYNKNGLKKIRFLINKKESKNYLSFFGFVKFRTRTEIIYFTKNKEIESLICNQVFQYTYLDSDEHI